MWVVVAVVVGGFFLLWKYSRGGWCYSQASLTGKTVLITGANTGIGKETAVDLTRRGAHVVLGVRDVIRGKTAAREILERTGKRVDVKQVDLASLVSVRAFVKDFLQCYERLDILINNAGVIAVSKMTSADGYELHFATNHLGHFLLTNLLLDLLKKSAPSRIVVVSAKAHKIARLDFDDLNYDKNYNFFMAYARSKLANILFAKELSRRLKGSGITVNSLHPGVVRTEIDRHIRAWIPSIFRPVAMAIVSPVLLFFKSPVEGAQTSIYCAVAGELEGVTGKYFSDCHEKSVSASADDIEAARRLWEVSARMVKLDTAD